MKIDNKEFYKVLFPSMKRIMESDAPIYSNMMMYGAPGQGKTMGIESLIETAKEMYGPENVHATITDGDVGLALAIGFDKRPIQILAIDDLTLKKVVNSELENFYKCRHLAMAKGMVKGYILTILVVHDFFAIPKHLRTYFDFMIACNPPTNKFDMNFLKGYLGGEIVRELFRLQRRKRVEDNLKAFKGYWFLGQSGFIQTVKPKARMRVASGWEDVLPPKHSPSKLKDGLDAICTKCQRSKGDCKEKKICEDAYRKLAKRTGISLENLLHIFMGYSEKVGEGEKHRGKEKRKKAEEEEEEEPEGAETEMDMHDEDHERGDD